MEDFPDLVKDHEQRSLVTRLAQFRGARGFTEQEAAALLSWAEISRRMNTMLQMILDGWVDPDVDPDGEIRFHATGQAHRRCKK